MRLQPRLLLTVAFLPFGACGDDAPVGIPYRYAILHVRGTLADEFGHPVREAVVSSWAIIWRDFLTAPGPEPFGGCQGRREAEVVTGVSDSMGVFHAPVDVSGDVTRFCVALKVYATDGYLGIGMSYDSLSLRPHARNALVDDTLRIHIILAGK